MRLLPLLLSFRGRIGRKSWWIGFVIWLAGNLSGTLLFNPEFFTAEELPPPNLADTVWQLAWLAPSRWGMAATAATVDLNNLQPLLHDTPPDGLWRHTQDVWLKDMGILLGLGLVFVAIAWWFLERLRPGRR